MTDDTTAFPWGCGDRHRHLKELIGRTVSFATFTQDEAGYDRVWMEFDDGTEFDIIEYSQTGEMRVKIT